MTLSRRKAFVAGSFALVAGAPSRVRSAGEEFTYRFSISVSVQSELFLMASEFARRVGRRSNGRLKIEIYPNSSIAAQKDEVSALQTGVVDFTIQASALLSALFPQMQALELPFIFKSQAAAYRVLDGPIGTDFFKNFESVGVLGMAWADDGFRQVETTTKAVRVPDDLKGMRLRIQNSPLSVGMVKAVGAIPITIDPAEVYMALRQNAIDGLEVPLTTVIAEKYDDIEHYIALTNHVLTITMLLGSKKKIEALPPDLQAIVKSEAKSFRSYTAPILSQRLDAARTALKAKGITFTEIDFGAFRKAMDPVYSGLEQRIGSEIIRRVSQTAGSA